MLQMTFYVAITENHFIQFKYVDTTPPNQISIRYREKNVHKSPLVKTHTLLHCTLILIEKLTGYKLFNGFPSLQAIFFNVDKYFISHLIEVTTRKMSVNRLVSVENILDRNPFRILPEWGLQEQSTRNKRSFVFRLTLSYTVNFRQS